jgi:photosystem II stability/assembly factor-like uncharacterized protein
MSKVLSILFLILLTHSGLDAQEYWLKQESPTTKNLNVCVFTDSLNGWIGGDSGLILHTTNKGKSWNSQNSGVKNGIISLYFVNKNVGFGLSLEFGETPPNYLGTRILTTKNGGSSWDNYLFADTGVFLNTIYFLDTLNGFIGGSEGKLLYTTDAGNCWIESILDSGIISGFPVVEIKFYNALTGFAAGGAFDIAGVIWNTTNGGRSWKSKIVGSEPVNDLYIFDSLNVLGVGGDFEYGASNVRTTNAGNFWQYRELGVFGIANSIAFRTQSETWVSLGIVDSFMISTNAGNNWKLTGTPNSSRIYDICFTDSINGWAVGVDGVILKYNSGVIGINESSSNYPGTFSLYQNYPNPFNPVTHLEFGISKLEFVSLKIYDILGNEVATLVNEKKSPGRYEVTFDGSDLPSGVYYYRIEAGSELMTKKMLLVK